MLITRMLFSICLLSTSIAIFAFAVLIRSIPALARVTSIFLRFILRWSYRLYHYLIILVEPEIQNQLGINLSEMPYRMLFSMFISCSVGLIVMLILGMHFSWFFLLVFGIHGFSVAWLWTNFFEPQGLHIGENV